MPVSVMQVGVVRVSVRQGDMTVPMRVRLSGRIARAMLVLVMQVVDVGVGVPQEFVDVVVLVPLGEVQIKAEGHE